MARSETKLQHGAGQPCASAARPSTASARRRWRRAWRCPLALHYYGAIRFEHWRGRPQRCHARVGRRLREWAQHLLDELVRVAWRGRQKFTPMVSSWMSPCDFELSTFAADAASPAVMRQRRLSAAATTSGSGDRQR